MASSPTFSATAQAAIGQLSAANTARDGTGTIVTVLTAGALGSRVERVTIQATSTTSNGMVRLFVHDGTNSRLFFEQPVFAVTPSASTPAFNTDILFGDARPLLLPNGYSLRASTEKAETFNVVAFGGSF